MNKLIFISGLFISAQLFAQEQEPIMVFESTLKVTGVGEEKFYFGFAEGDKIIFDFKEVNGKELKEIEIAEYPSSTKFMDYKTKEITNKSIPVTKTGIYVFRFSNSALAGRVCKVKVQRIPATETTKNFNTSVYWETVFDTTYTPVQEKYLVSRDTAIVNVVDQTAKISSQNALNGNSNTTLVDFTLPAHTVSWSFYIGVGEEGKQAYNDGKSKCMEGAAAASLKIPGFGPMAALALYGMSYFNRVQGEDNVKYYFLSDANSVTNFNAGQQFYQYKQGDVINDYYRMNSPLSGKVYLGLLNDNVMDPIDVMVKVTAITVTEKWDVRTVQKMEVHSDEVPYLKN